MSCSNRETIFSFEIVVKNVQLEKSSEDYHKLALGVRLLDFPMLLIYQSPLNSGRIEPPKHENQDEVRKYVFNKGKCCFFKMNLNSLHAYLCNTPLYAILLDMSETTPRFVGSFQISLAKLIDEIKLNGSAQENPTPSCMRQWRLSNISNITGENIGSASLSYKLICLGANLMPHIKETNGTDVLDGHQQENDKKINESAASLPFGSSTMKSSELRSQTSDLSGFDVSLNEAKQSESADVSAESHFQEDLTVFCPPHLYYSNTAQERRVHKKNSKLRNVELEAFPCDDLSSRNEEDKEKVKDSNSRPAHQTAAHTSHSLRNQDANSMTLNAITEALRQLPVLNALVNELSQLNIKSTNQCLTSHSSQASPEPAIRQQLVQTYTLRKAKKQNDFEIHLQPPRYNSTPIPNPEPVKVKKQKVDVSKPSRRKLVFGTTKTFNLRLEQISTLGIKRRECAELIQSKNLPRTDSKKVKSSRKNKKCSKKKSVINQHLNLNENIETVIEHVGPDTAMKETFTLKEKTQIKPDSQRCINIPTVDNESVSLAQDEKNPSEPEPERYTDISESSQRSRKSSFSDSIIEDHMGSEYADDFDSLESGDACTPNPISSPETSRAKTPVHSDLCNSSSTSENTRKKTISPRPVKESRSARRALTNTYTIRPRSSASAISFCSDDDVEFAGLTSRQTVSSGKQAEKNNVQQSSSENFLSSLSQGSESLRNAMEGLTVESVSSLDAQELEELEDELKSPDLRNDYKHISELVASKLPGYTM